MAAWHEMEAVRRIREMGHGFEGAGIYILLANGEVIYVGQSIDVSGRVKKHSVRGVEFWDDRVMFPCESGWHRRNIESALITCLAPQYNVQDNWEFDTERWRKIRPSLEEYGLEWVEDFAKKYTFYPRGFSEECGYEVRLGDDHLEWLQGRVGMVPASRYVVCTKAPEWDADYSAQKWRFCQEWSDYILETGYWAYE